MHTLTTNIADAQWEESAVVYGIIGLLELYSGTYFMICFRCACMV